MIDIMKDEKVKKKANMLSRVVRAHSEGEGIMPVVRAPLQVMTPQEVTRRHFIKEKQAGKFKMTSRITEETICAIATDKASGFTVKELAEKYAVSEGYINDAMQYAVVNKTKAAQILSGVLLTNAIAAGMHTKKKLEDLNGVQAAAVTGIMTKHFIDLDKHLSKKGDTEEVDVSAISSVTQDLKELNDMLRTGEED